MGINRFLLFLVVILIFWGCDNPEKSFNRGVQSRLVKDFQRVTDKYPDSEFSRQAELKIGEINYWSEIDSSLSVINYRTYLDSFPEGLFELEANGSLDLISAFKKARKEDVIESYALFQEQYPNSLFQDSIEQRLPILESALVGFQTLKDNEDVAALESYIREFEGTGYAKEISKKVDKVYLTEAEENIFSIGKYNTLPKSIDSLKIIITEKKDKSVLLAREAFENILIEQYKRKNAGFAYVIQEVEVLSPDLSTKYSIVKSNSNNLIQARLVKLLLHSGVTVSGVVTTKQKNNETYVIYTEYSNDLFPLAIESSFSGGELYGAKGKLTIKGFSEANFAMNTVWRFYGRCNLLPGYEITSETDGPLCFILKQGVGAVYLYGKGIVKSDKDEIILGEES